MSNAFIVIGDKSDHGGTVVTASPQADINGQPVARVGDPVACPKCRDVFPIVASVVIDGQAMARHGDKAACATPLIATKAQTFIGD